MEPRCAIFNHIEAVSRANWTTWLTAALDGVRTRLVLYEEEHMTAGEAPIKQAVKWIDDQLVDRPGIDRVTLVDEAARRFDLSPLDTDFLFRHLAERARRT